MVATVEGQAVPVPPATAFEGRGSRPGKRLSFRQAERLARVGSAREVVGGEDSYLIEKCREHLDGLSLTARVRWLNKKVAISVFGAQRCREMAASYQSKYDKGIRRVCSMPWAEAWDDTQQPTPADDGEHQRLRKHSSKMVESLASTSIGDGPRNWRYMPPQSVAEEDMLDLMSPMQAAHHPHPGSPSAAAIIRIGEIRAKPIGGEW
jgi:hypothetical protein